ncbi:RNA polymerase II mediator complex subunit [Ascochyta rabiei]|uniref:Mediator of RNA polymerase II transcription subunit 17 n=1 Tax=Didymella rabiei TaxID=5454 RepID=A0A163KPR6_DIDRA|nr:RNA polymerase II mediator complex subunit [Ascochyta rabiei]KZM27155.1 RNA polymerase II transcription cofactor [Ascochyta rabiei]UPX14163.1 RNA polymerase II mediator complex subunit [Ascochyta rabiei]
MSGVESLKDVALRPWPANKKDELSRDALLQQIEQLTTERGHLRDITEKSLQADIEAGKDVPDDAEEGSEDEEEEKDVPSRKEKMDEIFKMQMEMAGHLDWARFAATNALDLISLVLSADPNKRAPTSFSHTFREAGLNQGLPFASMGVARENHEQHHYKQEELDRKEELHRRQDLVSKAARMEALDAATDEILKAAKSLEKEVRRETKYWQEIVSISDKGWPIQRLRQNARHVPFGVRYGLPEASDHFKARGFAPLRMAKDGSIVLDPNLSLRPKTLRVRISEGGNITGSSQLPVESAGEGLAVEKSIRLARDSLLEEELYHEMSLETRQLLPYGVQLRGSVISVDEPGDNAFANRRLLIDCIPRDDRNSDNEEHTNDWLAHNVAEALRLLLTHEHSMRLYRRTQLPPPLTARKQEKKSPPLLRTLLAMLHHLQSVDALFTYLDTVSSTLRSAGLETSLTTSREESWIKLRESLGKSAKKDLSATDQLLDIFTKPFNGKATLTLPWSQGSQTEQLTIAIRTVIGAPTFGTEYKLTLPSSLTTDLGLSTENKFQSTADITSYIDWILSLYIAHRVLKNEYANRAAVKGNEARVTIMGKVSKKGASVKRDVSIDLRDGILALHLADSSLKGSSQESRSWPGKGEEGPLKEQVKSWVG